MDKVQARSKTSFVNVPKELKALSQWVVHKDKVPFNPLTGRRASANKPETWASYEDALKAFETGDYSGLGFELNHNGLVGIDLDKCVDPETGELSSQALEIVGSLDSYTEYSPSGSGLHIFVFGDISAEGRKSDWIEMYKASRYLTITGNVFGKLKPIANRPDEAKALYKKHFKDETEDSAELSIDESEETWLYDSIITQASESANGELFKRLFAGDYQGYPSQSEADLALCDILAYWTGSDASQMNDLFQMSGLMRDKWFEKRGKLSYGEKTIARALKQKSLTAPPKAGALDTFSAKDLQDEDIPPVNWLVKDLIPQGLTMVVAPPKAGKSWLVLDLCLSVSMGLPFLKKETSKCACLYLALEDSKRRLKTRLVKLLSFDEQAPDNFNYVLDVNPIDGGFQEQIEEYLSNHKDTGLIVVDTVQRIRVMSNNRNAYAQDYAEFSVLKKIADKHNIGLVLVHHTKKGKDDSDPFLSISGTNGILGVVDTALVLERKNRADSQATLYVTGRDAESPDLALEFNKDLCRWLVLGDAEQLEEKRRKEAYENDSLVMTIKGLLEDTGTWQGTTQEIYEAGFFQEDVRIVGKRLSSLESLLLEFDGILYTRKKTNGKSTHNFKYNLL